MSTVHIVNNQLTLLTLPVMPPKANLASTIRLMPGHNDIEVEALEHLTPNGKKDFNLWVDLNWIKPYSPAESVKLKGTKETPDTIVDRELPLALAFVEDETDAKKLKRWLGQDQRTEVKDAIKARMAKAKAAPKE